MVVAASTSHGRSKKRGADDVQGFGDDLVACNGLIDTAGGGSVRGHAQESRRRKLANVFRGQIFKGRAQDFVARKLFDHKLIHRHVVIVGVNHIVSIRKGPFSDRILIDVAFGICVTREVKPMTTPSFAIAGGCQHAINSSFQSIRSGVYTKLVDLIRMRRNSEKVKREAPQ